jgi:outer membrane protein assembly factor BamB
MGRIVDNGRMRSQFALAIVFVLSAAHTASAQDSATDYSQWRGQQRDGSASAFTPPRAWPEQLIQRWKVPIGEGYSTPLLAHDRVFTLTRRDGDEVVTALEAGTGKVIWQKSYPAPHKIASGAKAHGQGPKSTPLLYSGKLFTLGITGIVSAFNASDGTLLWQKPAPPVETLYNNSSMSPIADGDMVVFHVGGHNDGALTAFDIQTGNEKWSWKEDGPSYASPLIATFGGTRQVVAVTQQFVVGVDAATGALLWKRPFANKFFNNAISPIVFEDTIIISAYEQGVLALAPVRRNGVWELDTRWHAQDVSMFMSNPVLVGETLYGLSQKASGQFFALDARSGKVLWLGTPREATNTSVVKSGDLLFLLNDSAELIVAKASRDRFEPLKRYTVADSSTWAQPVISGHRIFVKDANFLTLWTVD